ncbi:MAG: hypothetical protein KAH84_08090 [Thiomargarita sp.]|nr:hypothetical protein [Thiomargarita sp.]
MEIFINEFSLEGQFATETEFQEAVKVFTTIFVIIKKIQSKKVYKDSILLLDSEAIKGSNFKKNLNNIRDKSLKQAFINIVFNKLNPKEWRDEQVHSINNDFDYITETKNQDVRNTSLAEVTERSLQNKGIIYLLINFTNSRFKFAHPDIPKCFLIPIIKNSDENNPINLDCLDEKSALENWLKVKINLYDESTNLPPTDEQTILSNNTQFEKTSLICQGRNIYRELAIHRYWYIDNLHYGKAAHLEVFDKTGKHVGEANLLGNIDYSKKDSTKTISIK